LTEPKLSHQPLLHFQAVRTKGCEGTSSTAELTYEHAGTQFCPSVVDALEELSRSEPALLAAEPAERIRVA